MKKERVDVLAVQQGLFETREQAKRGVMAGLVYTEKNERLDKPGEKISGETQLQIKGKKLPYVSRGGLKLEKALKIFDFEVKDQILLDIGASTGGFTDAALQNGAKMSYALDVGYNQLAWKLRQDPRVVVMERVNFRYAKPTDFLEGLPERATIDVSFISLKLILPPLHEILVDQGEVIALIKPQFEAGKASVGKTALFVILQSIKGFSKKSWTLPNRMALIFLILVFHRSRAVKATLNFWFIYRKCRMVMAQGKPKSLSLRSLLKHMKPFIIQKLTDFAELVFYMPALFLSV